MFFYCIELPPRGWVTSQKFPLGVSPRALSRASSACLGAQEHRGEALCSTNSPHQNSRKSCFARAPSRSKFGDSFLRELRLTLVSRLGSSQSWLSQPSKLIAKLLGSFCDATTSLSLGPHCTCTGARSRELRDGAFFLPRQHLPRKQRERPGIPSPRGQGWNNHLLGPPYETPYKLNSMYVSRYSTVNETFFLTKLLRHHSPPRFNSNTSRALNAANSERWGIIQSTWPRTMGNCKVVKW